MAFTRTQMVAAVAGTLSLAVLTGCPANPTATGTPAPGASASAAPAAAGSTAPTTAPAATAAPTAAPSASMAPSTAPSGTGSAGPSVAPSASAPAPSGDKVIVSGNVYDEEGATVDGALITVKSLDTSVPYTATATTSQGSWVVNNVPEGANVEVVATKGGWTSRRRTASFQKQATGRKNIVNFGAAGGNASTDAEDATGESYFISDYPEIASTEPKTDATGVDSQKLSFKLRVSEPLDEDSRDTLKDSLTILPANTEARGATLASNFDLETGEDDDASDGTSGFTVTGVNAGGFGYSIREGSTFLGNSDRDVTATWNAEGTELTFSFDATLLSDDNDEAKYQAVLLSQGTATENKIEDEDGNQLGTDSDGDLKGYPAANVIIANTFREIDLSAADTVTGGATTDRGEVNWATTHDSAVNWEIKRDETDPKLTAVDVSDDVDGDFRIELTFSEGMAAYNNTTTGAYDQTGIEDGLQANFRFSIGDKPGDTEDVDLSDGTVTNITTVPVTTVVADRLGNDDSEMEKRYSFDQALVQNNQSTEDGGITTDVTSVDDADLTAGEIYVEVDEDNPNTVFVWIKDRPNYFDSKVSEIKAYIDTVKDPAGNSISDNDAEDNQVRASI